MSQFAFQGNLKRDPGTGLFIWWLQDDPQWPVDLSILSAEEQARAKRYRTVEKQRQFTFTRWAGRLLFARELGVSPQDVVWTAQGAPEISVAGESSPRISVSVSHTGNNSLIAIGPRDLALGIDVERIVQSESVSAIATAALTAREREQLLKLSPADQPLFLTTIWTIKEAVLKSLKGIDVPDWTSLEVELSSDWERPLVSAISSSSRQGNSFTCERIRTILNQTCVIPLPFNSGVAGDLLGAISVRPLAPASGRANCPRVTFRGMCNGNLFNFVNYEENGIILLIRLCQGNVTIFD